MIDVIKKHAKFFVNEEHENVNARTVNYYADGSLFMCDGIIGVYAYNVHSEGAKVTSVTGRKLDNGGLTQDKALMLIKEPKQVEEKANAICNVEVPDLLNYVQTVNKIDVEPEDEGKAKPKPLKLTFDTDGFSVKAHRFDFSAKYHDSEYSFTESHSAGLDARRLETVLKFIKDVGYEDVKLFCSSIGAPVEFRSYDGLLRVIVMQLRLY